MNNFIASSNGGFVLLPLGANNDATLWAGGTSVGTAYLQGTLATDTVSLLATSGGLPSWLAVSRVDPPVNNAAWKIVNSRASSGNGQAIVIVAVTRNGITDKERVIAPLGAVTKTGIAGNAAWLDSDGTTPRTKLFGAEGSGAYNTVFLTAGQTFDLLIGAGEEFGYVGPWSMEVGLCPSWMTVTQTSATSANLRVTGTAPNMVTSGSFTAISTGAFVQDGPVYKDVCAYYFVVLPPDDLWTATAYTATAVPTQPFGWNFADKVFAGSTVTITAGPAWLGIAGSTVSGTPPASTADSTVTVTLLASNSGVTETATLTITIGDLPWGGGGSGGSGDGGLNLGLWFDDPYTDTAVATNPYTFSVVGKLYPGATFAPGMGLPSWLAQVGLTLTGMPPADAAGTSVTLMLIGSYQTITENAFLTINIQPVSSMFQNAPYALSTPEGKSFEFTIVLTDQSASVAAAGLPPWLVFTPENLTFSGTPPLGSGGKVFTIPLTATDGDQSETTTFTLTVSALSTLGVTLDPRTGGVSFDGGKLIIKHGDYVAILVNITPAGQGAFVTGLRYKVRESTAASLKSYGYLLNQDQCARVGATDSFQFVALPFMNLELDHVLTVLDPVLVQPSVDFVFQFEYAYNGLAKTSQLAVFSMERDFSLDTSAGGALEPSAQTLARTLGAAAPASGGGVIPVSFELAADVTQDAIFGYFKLPVPASITEASIEIQAPDAGAGVTVALTNENGVPYGDAYAVGSGAGARIGTADYTSVGPLVLQAGSIVCGKITQYAPSGGNNSAAQFLTLRFVCRQ